MKMIINIANVSAHCISETKQKHIISSHNIFFERDTEKNTYFDTKVRVKRALARRRRDSTEIRLIVQVTTTRSYGNDECARYTWVPNTHEYHTAGLPGFGINKRAVRTLVLV